MKKKENDRVSSIPPLPVVKVTYDEFRNAADGHPSKRVERLLSKIGGIMFRYEITDLPQHNPPVTDLYFILHGNFVKIGQSTNPYKRLIEFQTGAPEILKVLAIIPQKGEIEKFCHKRLKHLHFRGEWFRYTGEVDTLIEEIRNLLP